MEMIISDVKCDSCGRSNSVTKIFGDEINNWTWSFCEECFRNIDVSALCHSCDIFCAGELCRWCTEQLQPDIATIDVVFMTGERIQIEIDTIETLSGLIREIETHDVGKTIPIDKDKKWGFFSPNHTDDTGERQQIDNDTQIGDIVTNFDDKRTTELYALPGEPDTPECYDCGCKTTLCKRKSHYNIGGQDGVDIFLCPYCVDEEEQSCLNETEEGMCQDRGLPYTLMCSYCKCVY